MLSVRLRVLRLVASVVPRSSVSVSWRSVSVFRASETPAHTHSHHRPCHTFTSAHFRMDEGTIAAYLNRKSIKFELVPGEFKVRVCPFCPPHKNKADNLWKLYISRETGQYFCHRCGSKGNWFAFKSALGDGGGAVAGSVVTSPMLGGEGTASSTTRTATVGGTGVGFGGGGGGGGIGLDQAELPGVEMKTVTDGKAALFEDPAFAGVLEYLTSERGLTPDVLKEYLVGACSKPFRKDDGPGWVHEDCIMFPWVSADPDSATDTDEAALVGRRVKYRSVTTKSHQSMEPRGGMRGMFGMHTVPPSESTVVITEGEFDAMTVRQATGVHAVSLPNGARSLPVELLPWLEQFQTIYLWMDDDSAGRDACEKLVSKLGVGRCLLVRSSPELSAGKPHAKDANDAFRLGYDLSAMLSAARPQPHEQILSFQDLRPDVFQELMDPVQVSGTPYRWLPGLQSNLKGHRLGELTILTGSTGSGKTTLLSQISLDLCDQGIPTLWGSFEIKNVRLLKRMMMQYHGGSLDGAELDTLERVSERFQDLPMYFLKFFGTTDIDRVLDAMEYAVYVNDVEHIILDNLQFMMGTSTGRGFDRFESQERALDKFRQFASTQNVHVTLVVHPRKEDEHVRLGLSSVFGTAKATQEADNVLILQATQEGKYIDIRKNRFDGTAGKIGVAYNTESQRFEEVAGGGGGGEDRPSSWPAEMHRQQTTTITTTTPVGARGEGGTGGYVPRSRRTQPVVTYKQPSGGGAGAGAGAAAAPQTPTTTKTTTTGAPPVFDSPGARQLTVELGNELDEIIME